MTKIDAELKAGEASIAPGNSQELSVELVDVDTDELLEVIGQEEAIAYFGEEELIKSIGLDTVKRYFGLVEKEDAE